MAAFRGELAGASAAVASIEGAKAAQNVRMETAAADAIEIGQSEAKATGATTRAAVTEISASGASSGTIVANANSSGTIARTQTRYPFINKDPRMTNPRQVPMWDRIASTRGPPSRFSGVGPIRSPPPHFQGQDSKKRQPSSYYNHQRE